MRARLLIDSQRREGDFVGAFRAVARVMGIADIFEALTAKDRPYRPGMKLPEALSILGKFKLNGHVAPDLFDVFVRQKVYLRYAEQFLDPAQIDAVDEMAIPGYAG